MNRGNQPQIARRRSFFILQPSAFILLFCCGCPQYADPTVPNPIHRVREPSSNRDYLIYTPSGYAPDRPTPLVVVCHGSRPWDYPLRQIRDWVKLAEEKDFIVAAPDLEGTQGFLPPPAAKQIARQYQDEGTILAMLRHIRGSRNIRQDRVFLNGWSAGSYAVLYTGLRNPDIFRALSVLQGNFDAVYLTEAADSIDPYQPIFVLYGSIDFMTRAQGKKCLEWLYDHGAYACENQVPGLHRSHPQQAYDFFERVVREVPWLHLRAFAADPNNPYTVQFKTRGSFKPETYDWSFGDGKTSPIAGPRHTYAEPGQYRVTLVAGTPKGGRAKRTLRLKVPLTQLQHALDE